MAGQRILAVPANPASERAKDGGAHSSLTAQQWLLPIRRLGVHGSRIRELSARQDHAKQLCPPAYARGSEPSVNLDTALERNNNMFPKSAYVYRSGEHGRSNAIQRPTFTLRGDKPRIVHTHAKVVRNAGRVAGNLFDRPLRVT
jgi:hypothetical protein